MKTDGCWSIDGGALLELAAATGTRSTVFAPSFQRVVTNRVTDPYSVALTVNSTHSVIVDLDDPALRPHDVALRRPAAARQARSTR